MGTRRARTSKTAEQAAAERRERAEQMQAQIAAQVQTMAESIGWREWLDYLANFHSYSLRNILLIAAQRPDATQVAGFRTWQSLGRQVRKGEKAIRIFGFSSKKVTETDPATGDETETRIPRFPILSVFDIAQTDPIDGTEDRTVTEPGDIVTHVHGDDETGIYDRVAAFITAQGWTITREQIPGTTNGYTRVDGTKLIVVDADLAPAQAAKTMIHETAHAMLLHADTDGHRVDTLDIEQHRGIREVEAESVAYVVAALCGLDTSAYSVGYITGWADGDPEIVTATATRVLACVHTIADALHPQSEDHDDTDDQDDTDAHTADAA
ncbi:ArdC-like ssDNA-binding domain-containing protein [Williamsia sp. CHRR-6]|uniref:ArdC-like ssDNA-binding domain-containing protein n=1 Tax=Williamsia sp. CHRR-6 TaxID=2835871 RepID=UPI001BDA832E|nr:ArdC-like ssDNA-binding domain-containing protein [Williamsia sp. CHRR-6]MBT0568588.1 ImmA/IrrE family metallo-endopeptidase [Williamsia sp. CHRR-6]